ncbi:MAG: extracellular solute-binding protein [Paenibacillus sp.]|nr:extracellular solute-binding protein [Paenibacillus sp.]
MNKKVTLLFTAILMLTLTSCASVNINSGVLDEEIIENPETNIHYVSSNIEDQGSARIIGDLAKEYIETHPLTTYNPENVQVPDLQRKIQLLGASNDLPTMFSYESGTALEDLIDSGLVLNIEDTFRDLGIYDELKPATVELLKSIVDDKGLYTLPLEINVEGFWYNKQMFTQYGLKEPKTWDEMLEAAKIFKRNGIQPFSLAGKEKWPITRLINGYVIRKYGYDVMKRVNKGELAVTSSGFIEAASIVQDMSLKGYFGATPNSVSADASVDLFLQGRAAMMYTGSWQLRDFNDPQRNKIGEDNIGLFNIPLVQNGVGTLADWPLNAGLTTSFAASTYNESVGDWMKYVFSRYGDKAMNDLGIIPGFKVHNMPEDIPPLTSLAMKRIDEAKQGALWFEAYFDAKAQSTAWNNAQRLIFDSSYTPLMYMEELQEVLDKQMN